MAASPTSTRLFDINLHNGLYVNGRAYDFTTRRSVTDTFAQLQASGLNPSLRAVARMTGTSHNFVAKIMDWESRGRSILARPRGGAIRVGLEEWEREYLAFLVLSGTCYNDEDYWMRLVVDLHCDACLRTVRNALNAMKATVRKTNKEPVDKYNADNTVRLAEFVEEVCDVPRARLRFYDQTGICYKDILAGKRRQFQGLPNNEYVASDFRSGVHYSTFGLTSIRPEQPPLLFKIYEATSENGQCVDEHLDFFQSTLAGGHLRANYGVVVRDNWAAHTGEFGQMLDDLLQDQFGIAVVPLPSCYAALNPIEFLWNTSKARTRRLRAMLGIIETDSTPLLFAHAMSSITHKNVANTYAHCGYQIEDGALRSLAAAGLL